MVNFNPPPEGIDPKVYNYLYQLAELLNINAQRTVGAAPVQQAPVSAAPMQQTGGTKLDEATYAALKGLIIKTADETTSTQVNPLQQELTKQAKELADSIEGLTKTVGEMSGEYVAKSEFGSYIQQINAEIEANPEAITQYYSFVSALKANIDAVNAGFEDYKTNTEGYIRSGIVYCDGDGRPVLGVAVGQNLTATEVDGKQVVDQNDFRATFTAKKLSFWQDATEVAYVSGNQLYIPGVAKLGGMQLGGKWDISIANGLAFKWIGG